SSSATNSTWRSSTVGRSTRARCRSPRSAVCWMPKPRDNRRMSDVPARQPSPFPPRRSLTGAILAWARDLALSVVIAFVVIIFIYQPVKVEGNSMLPGLVDQERIFVNKFGYRFGIGSIERGDVIVFWFPGDLSKSYIKRVIGLPGDTIEIDRGT